MSAVSSVSNSRMRRRAARSSEDSPCRDTGSFATVDVILLDPLRQRDRVDTQIVSSLILRLAGAHERDRTGTKLSRVGTAHDGQPFVQAAN